MSDDEDDYLYSLKKPDTEGSDRVAVEKTSEEREERRVTTADAPARNGDEKMEDSDESDVEFIIEKKPGQKVEAPARQSGHQIRVTAPTPTVSRGTAEGKEDAKVQTAPPDTKKDEIPVSRLPGIDLDTPAHFEGKPIVEVDIESIEQKPWRQPGADLTDYFNYGFDEFTWTAYCGKQSKLREEYNPQKMMAQMMGMGMGMGMGMDMGMGMGMPGFDMMFPPMDMAGMQMPNMGMQTMNWDTNNMNVNYYGNSPAPQGQGQQTQQKASPSNFSSNSPAPMQAQPSAPGLPSSSNAPSQAVPTGPIIAAPSGPRPKGVPNAPTGPRGGVRRR